MWLVSDKEDWDNDGRWWNVQLRIGFHPRGRSGEALVRDGLEIVALLNATAGQLDRTNTLDLLRSGHAQALIGQPEGPWLETKREHYDLKSDAGQIKLARAVTQFANSECGGLVVVGLATKKHAGIDAIHAVMPMAHNPNIRRRYVQILQNRIYPPPDNLRVEVIAVPDGELVVIDIPAQPEELKPFLVHGAVIEGRVNDTFISIVQRREDEESQVRSPVSMPCWRLVERSYATATCGSPPRRAPQSEPVTAVPEPERFLGAVTRSMSEVLHASNLIEVPTPKLLATHSGIPGAVV